MKFALSLFILPCMLYAEINLQQWQYRRPIKIADFPSTVEFVLDADVYRHAQADLRDVRILRDSAETPYQLRVLSGSKEERRRSLAILDRTFVSGRGVQAVLDLGGTASHNRVEIVTGKQNFKEAVIVETSDDRRIWAVARNDALIFDISREHRHVDDLTIEYPESTARYVRLTVAGWNSAADLQSAHSTYVTEQAPIRDILVAAAPSITQNVKEQTTSFQVDTGVQGQPYDQLDLTTGPQLFFRNVEVFTSSDGQQWAYASGGVVRRTADADDHLISVAEQSNRFIRVVVANGDNVPIEVTRIAVSGIRRVARFSAPQSGLYLLYMGNNATASPRYDYALVTSATVTAPLATLAKTEPNPSYKLPEKPFSERSPVLLNSLLVLAVLSMGFIAVRFLRKVRVS